MKLFTTIALVAGTYFVAKHNIDLSQLSHAQEFVTAYISDHWVKSSGISAATFFAVAKTWATINA